MSKADRRRRKKANRQRSRDNYQALLQGIDHWAAMEGCYDLDRIAAELGMERGNLELRLLHHHGMLDVETERRLCEAEGEPLSEQATAPFTADELAIVDRFMLGPLPEPGEALTWIRLDPALTAPA